MMVRDINMICEDGSVHHIKVYKASRTIRGELVMNYIDITDNNKECFTEIAQIDGVFTAIDTVNEWSYYATAIEDIEDSFSTLPDEMHIIKKENNTKNI